MIAGQERQQQPVTLYKNTHLRIHKYKNTQGEIRFIKNEMQNANTLRKDGHLTYNAICV